MQHGEISKPVNNENMANIIKDDTIKENDYKSMQKNSNDEKTKILKSDIKMEVEDNIIMQTNNQPININIELKSDLNRKDGSNDDDGEDLPENFFDDFSNNDFMAGLDIVDDWVDEENIENMKSESSLSREKKDLDKRKYSRSPGKYKERDHKHRTSRERRSRDNDRSRYLGRPRDCRSRSRDYDRRRKSRDREIDRRSPRKRSKDRRRSQERHKLREQLTEKGAVTQKPSLDLTSTGKAAEDIDTRRDPEKTKRDIQRDKIRCAKDFEARVLQEQLKVAESGLFPPGTELDVVLELEKKKAEALDKEVEENKEYNLEKIVDVKKQENHKIVEVRPRKQSHSPRKSPVERRSQRSRSPRRIRTPRRSRSLRRSRTPRRSRSPEYRFRKRIFSRLDRPRERSYSPRRLRRRMRSLERRKSRSRSLQRRSRSLDREELLRRNDDLRLQLRAKRRERYIKDLSPVSEARFSRSRSPSNMNLSAISKVSEREMWLRNKDRYKQRYGRSISPVSLSSVDGDGGSPRCKRSKQNSLSFIKDNERIAAIDKKINNSSSEVPHPVPPPVQIHPTQSVNLQFTPGTQPYMNPMQYHQGQMMQPIQPLMDIQHGMLSTSQQTSILGVPPPLSMMPMMDMNMLMSMPGHVIPGVGVPQPIDLQAAQLQQTAHNQNTVQLQQHAVQLQQQQKHQNRNQTIVSKSSAAPATTNKEVTKLFEEQKISLSDYLSVSAKPIDPTTPINLHKKIKVISKCQEVIRILSDESKFSGRFIPKLPPPGAERQQESNTMKWKSPLRKVFPLRFMFTTPSKKTTTQESVKTLLNKLLLVCDIPLILDNNSSKKSCVNPAATVPFVAAANIPKVSNNSISKPINNYRNNSNSPVVAQPIPKPVPPPISFAIREQKSKVPLYKTESIQTDPVKCQICEIRSARKYVDSSTQTSEKCMEDHSTQVTQEDLTKSSVIFAPRGILKNSGGVQSLSHLTPAQLLALKQEDNTNTEWSSSLRHETFPISKNSSVSNSMGGRSLSGTGQNSISGNSSFNPSFGMNFDQLTYNNMLSNRGMGSTNDLQAIITRANMYDPRNMMNDSISMNDARNNLISDNRSMMADNRNIMNQRPDFNDPNFRNPSNIFGGHLPNRGGGNSQNRNFFGSIWK